MFQNLGREGKTTLINNVLKKDASGKYVVDFENRAYAELRIRSYSRSKKEKDNGVIMEEAQTRCGSAEKLATAVREGRVKAKPQHRTN